MNMYDPRHNEEPDEADLQAPPALVEALRERKAPRVEVPAGVDRAILNRAHQHLARVRAGQPESPAREPKLIPFPGVWVRLAAAAAMVLLAAVIWFRPIPEAGIALDEPTVIDAFRLARKVEAGEVLSPAYDLNSDGSVNAADARFLVQRAVTLPEGGAL